MKTPPQLLCVSLNPAIDRRIWVSELKPGEVNRASKVDPAPGGKAAHVAFAAHALGVQAEWLGFLGGAEGEVCRAGLVNRGIDVVPVRIAGRTRTNLEIIVDGTSSATEILEPGPEVSPQEVENLLREFETQVAHSAVVVASGSLPPGVPSSFYAMLVETAAEAGRRVLVDASGKALAGVLPARPFLIKPNRQEAEGLIGRPIRSVEEAVAAGVELRERGPEHVVVSLGAEGAVVVSPQAAFHAVPPRLKPVSAVGSGDSFLAGWAVGLLRGLPETECLQLGIACGAANCVAASPGCISPETVDQMSARVQIQEVFRR